MQGTGRRNRENVVVIGASAKPERYSNKGIQMLAKYGHTPTPVASREQEIEERKAYTHLSGMTEKVGSVTMYVGAARQGELSGEIAGIDMVALLILQARTDHAPESTQQFGEAGLRLVIFDRAGLGMAGRVRAHPS